jgi:pantothenate kinase
VGYSHPSLVAAARAEIVARLDEGGADRAYPFMVGVTGAPAAGKSTLAASVADALCARSGAGTAIAIGMDGFHLSNTELARLGLESRKGAPETFDAHGFVALLRRLRAAEDPIVYAPAYSRTVHESVGGVVPIPSGTAVLVIEGNYLLLDRSPWDRVRELLDLVLYLDVPAAVRVPSLMRRQRARGLDRDAAHDWVHRSDEANADLIASTRCRADVILTRPG